MDIVKFIVILGVVTTYIIITHKKLDQHQKILKAVLYFLVFIEAFLGTAFPTLNIPEKFELLETFNDVDLKVYVAILAAIECYEIISTLLENANQKANQIK